MSALPSCFLIEAQPGVQLVVAFGSRPDLTVRLLALWPDVVLLEWGLPDYLAEQVLLAARRAPCILLEAPLRGRRFPMGFQDLMLWILSVTLLAIYIACVFTVCSLTFQKGYRLLGWVGIFFPILWLIGAVLPPKPDSQFARKQAMTRQR